MEEDEERGIVRVRSGSQEVLLKKNGVLKETQRCDWKYVWDEIW